MASNSTVPNEILLPSLVFKFIAMIIGVLGNITVITFPEQREDSDILLGRKLGTGRSSRVLNILSNMDY
jgi:hypothetical protein